MRICGLRKISPGDTAGGQSQPAGTTSALVRVFVQVAGMRVVRGLALQARPQCPLERPPLGITDDVGSRHGAQNSNKCSGGPFLLRLLARISITIGISHNKQIPSATSILLCNQECAC